jgi:hypothetical protein
LGSVRFDDRLRTVMTRRSWTRTIDRPLAPAGRSPSRPHDELDPALLDAALTMVQSGARAVPKAVRAATTCSIAGRAAEPRLIAILPPTS